MASISASDVKRLREATSAGMMECKKALEESGGDFDKAVEALAKLYALDMRPAAFASNSFALTGHHHIPCLLHRLDIQHFHAYFFTTYARGQIEALADAALEFGVDVTQAG